MSRRGYALTELLVVIAVGSVLLGIACGLVVLLLGIEQSSRESLRQQVALADLARQFRRDVRNGARLLPPDGKPQAASAWRIAAAEGAVIQYRVEGSSLIRALLHGGVVREQQAYQLPEDAQVAIDVSAARGPAIVSLSITTPQGKPIRGSPCAVEIDAALGADGTLLGAAAERGFR
jgi:prepilin-type N-terminal cleavage/methylation domain-containing protein